MHEWLSGCVAINPVSPRNTFCLVHLLWCFCSEAGAGAMLDLAGGAVGQLPAAPAQTPASTASVNAQVGDVERTTSRGCVRAPVRCTHGYSSSSCRYAVADGQSPVRGNGPTAATAPHSCVLGQGSTVNGQRATGMPHGRRHCD